MHLNRRFYVMTARPELEVLTVGELSHEFSGQNLGPSILTDAPVQSSSTLLHDTDVLIESLIHIIIIIRTSKS